MLFNKPSVSYEDIKVFKEKKTLLFKDDGSFLNF